MGWTEERVSELKKLWAEGHSASQIAKRLGSVTRNRQGAPSRTLRPGDSVPPGQAPAAPCPSQTHDSPASCPVGPGRPWRDCPGRPPGTRPTAHHRGRSQYRAPAPAQRRHGHGPDGEGFDVQMADRRSGRRRLRLLRPRHVGRLTLLRRPRPRRLPARQEARIRFYSSTRDGAAPESTGVRGGFVLRVARAVGSRE
jgi:GcrA cell cycle regulator